MFEFEAFAVNGVQLIAVVFGLVEFFKHLFNLEGKAVTALSMCMGILVMVAYQLIGIVPEPYGQIVGIVAASVAFGLSASGYYKFLAPRLPKSEG
jgi:hypothetical protein